MSLFSPAQLAQLAKSMAKHTSAEVRLGPYDRALYATDASMYQIQPLGVVVPRSVADVAAVMALAAEQRIPLVPRGGGTSLSGQSIGAGLVLDLSKYLRRIIDLDAASGTARVEPGVILDELNAAAARSGLQFGPDVATSSRANLGGMIGNNSAGSRSILQGKTVDHVRALDVVLADGSQARLQPMSMVEHAAKFSASSTLGRVRVAAEQIVAEHRDEIVRRFPALVRRVSGYNLDELVPECGARLALPPGAQAARDRERLLYPGADWNLAKLVVGAEGSLAVVTGAELNLVPVPAARGLMVLEFESLTAAIESVGPILACGPSAIELFDRMILELAATSLEYRSYLDFVTGRPESLILVEFAGASEEEVQSRLDELAARLTGWPALSHMLATRDAALAAHIWACRKAALPLLMGLPGTRKPLAFVEDTAVDPARLPEFVARFRQLLREVGVEGAFYGHASVGVLHIRPLVDTRLPEDLQKIEIILDRVSDLVLEFGGAMSGEHGDGLARSYLNKKLFGPRIYGAFRQLKAAFDPHALLNPGKVVEGPSPIENLRHPPRSLPIVPQTVFDFSGQGGFAAAADLCNGAGVCRKLHSGTMCPSFMGTGDEEHSTRGRANALRQVLSGTLPEENLASARLHETYELCLQCKGCKAECPSNVDVAKLKAEFLQHYHDAHGVKLGTWAMAHVHRLNRLGSALAPLSNWLGRLPGSGWIAERVFGIDRRQSLPTFERQHFARWFRARPVQPAGRRGDVVLLDDCLTSYCEPQVNRAACELLEAAGYRVRLASLPCCGRAMISKGLLREAQELARANLASLDVWASRGVPIVGCEPSCVLTIVDDYRDLVPGEVAERVAASTQLVDGLLADAADDLELRPADKPILLHGHCHQKALVGLAATRRMVESVAGARMSVVDSGCCGMAGSFGYEHYDLSQKIAERVLLPAVRASGESDVLAPGFSCRHQIAHGTGRLALHPVEWLRRQWQAPGRGGE